RGAFGATEAPRGLGVREAGEPDQHDDLAPGGREVREGAFEALELLARDGLVAGPGPGAILEQVRDAGRGRLLARRAASQPVPEAPAAGQLVLGRARQPAPEARSHRLPEVAEAVHAGQRLA